ncbi:WD_REPEATS_REGION domain-containing protein, partial [Mortierella sp. AD010]
MVRNPFSSSKIRPSLAEAIKTANDCLKMACNDSDLKTALQLADEAKSKIQEAEKIFATERVGKPTIDNGIAIAYHEHGKLLDKLRSHKAQESYSNAKKWGYIEVVNQQIYSPLLGDMDSSNRRSVIHLIALAAIPNLSTAIRQDIPGLGAILPISNDLAEVPPTKTYDIANHQDIYLYSGLDVEVAIIKLRRQRLMNKGEPYVMPRAKRYLNSEGTFDLTYDVQGFLKSDKKVFLLLGDSGAGKSTFIRALETKLWTAYQEDTNKNIPIFVDLPSIANPEQDLIAKQLRRFDFTEEQIMDLKSQRQITLICDGYDECHQTTNLYKSNQLNQPGGWVVQMVISCGTEYIGMDYKDRFQPIDQNNCRVSNLFQEAVVMPFNKNQIQDYINQYVSVNKSTTTNWSADDYKKAIGDIPNLLELVVDPFLLKLAVEVLPQLVDLRKDVSSKITRIVLYDIFVAQWIERSMLRLMTTTLTPRDKESFKTLTTSGFTEHSINYLKELATKVYYNQGGNPVIDHIGYRDRGTLKESFSDDTEDKNLLREAIPIVRDGGQYRFIHKSILEYGLALAVYDPNTQNHMSVPSRSLESLPLTEWVAAADERSLLDSPLRKRNLVGERSILQFLAERVQQEPV